MTKLETTKLTGKIILGVYVFIASVFLPMWALGELDQVPLYQSDKTKQMLNATSTYEVTLEGVNDTTTLKDKLEKTVKQHKLTEKEQELTTELQEVKKQQANLE